MTTPPPERVVEKFPHLDALRAVGAVAVLTTHTAFWGGEYTDNGTAGRLLARLDVGVALFFVLSGFLLSRAWLQAAADSSPRPETGHYLWKRFLRIVPVYLVAVLAALWFIDANAALTTGDRAAALLLSSSLVDPSFPAGLTHMWSLMVEVHFYLLLPLLMLLATGRRGGLDVRRTCAVLVTMLAVSVWWHLDGALRVGEGRSIDAGQWLPAYLGWFAVGIGLALAQVLLVRGRAGRGTTLLVRLAAQPGVCWSAAGGLLLVASTPVAGPVLLAAPTTGQSLTKNLLYAAVGGLLVLPAVLRQRHADAPATTFDRLLTNRAARHLGLVSYGIFCLHLPLLHLVMWATGWELFAGRGLQIWALTLVISVIAAEAAYRLVERPALRLKTLHPLRRRGAAPAEKSTAVTGSTTR